MNIAMIADDLRYQLAPYCDRVVPPGETVRRLEPFLADFGITRVARQTGLDRIGIPCFAAFRPNASTLSNSQGKGLDDDAARASAVMEAVEFAIAEQPILPMEAATTAELRADGIAGIRLPAVAAHRAGDTRRHAARLRTRSSTC